MSIHISRDCWQEEIARYIYTSMREHKQKKLSGREMRQEQNKCENESFLYGRRGDKELISNSKNEESPKKEEEEGWIVEREGRI